MNKKYVIIAIFASIAILFFSFTIKNCSSKKSAHLVNKIDSKNKESLLAAAGAYETKKDYLKAKIILEKLIEEFPDPKQATKAQKGIEELNVKILFSDTLTEDSENYKIKRGDALAKIASRFNTTVELIKKANNLETDLIIPGRSLKVNTARFNILVSKAENTLILQKSDGEIIKSYLVSTGKNLSTPVGTFRIEEKLVKPLWYKVGAVVEPNSPEYELGSRWMGLSVEGYGIHGTNDVSSIGKHITKGCVRMVNEDVEELYAIVPSGTEVTIIE